MALLQLAKASVSGAFELLPSSFIFWKTGDSLRRSRIQTETAEQHDRHQERNAPAPGGEVGLADARVRVNRITSSDRNRPSVAVVWMNEV